MDSEAVDDDRDASLSRHLTDSLDQYEHSGCLSIKKLGTMAKYDVVEKDIYSRHGERMEWCHDIVLDLGLITSLR